MRWLARLPAAFWIGAGLLLSTSMLALMYLRDWDFNEFVALFFVQLAIYGFAAWRLLGGKLHAETDERLALIGILTVAVLLRGIALWAPQALSTDAFRYVWDGRVQAAHVNPYRYIPVDPALVPLRDAVIYPNINRADYAHTIYPPTAQVAFLAIERISDSIIGMKLGMLAFDGLAIACLIALLRGRGLPATRVMLYAWHPLPIWEFAGTGHIDALAISLLLLAFVFASRRAPLLTGVLFAAATLVKYYPVLAAPALYRRWDWRMPAAFAVTALLLYLPYLGVGSGVLGFLPGYATEEGLHSGDGIFLWSLLRTLGAVPAQGLRFFLPLSALVMLALGLWTQFRSQARARDDLLDTFLLATVFTLLVSPHDPWYFTWLVPFLCFRVSVAHIWLTGACVAMYVLPNPTGVQVQSLIYLPFLLLLFVQSWLKRQFASPEIFDANRAQRQSGT